MPELPPPSTHQCPAPGCALRVPRRQFSCPFHWGQLPAEMRREINDTYGRDWPAWTRAAQAAIDLLNAQVGAS